MVGFVVLVLTWNWSGCLDGLTLELLSWFGQVLLRIMYIFGDSGPECMCLAWYSLLLLKVTLS